MKPPRVADGPRAAAAGAAVSLLWIVTRGAWTSPYPALAQQGSGDAVVYSGGLARGWQDWSWAPRSLRSMEYPFGGKPAIRMQPAGWNAIYLHTDGLDTTGYAALAMWVHGGAAGGQRILACLADSRQRFGRKAELGRYMVGGRIPAGRWAIALIPLSALGGTGAAITGIALQEGLGRAQPAVHFAEVRLVAGKARAPRACQVTIDADLGGRPISPLIYGMALAGAAHVQDLRLGSNRWGGNPNTRYNWEGNHWNAARDWEFRNYGGTKAGDRTAGISADRFIARNRAAGAATVLTIPTIGWVAKDGSNATRSVGVPREGGVPVAPGSDAIAGYDPAANRRRTSVRSLARKGAPFQYPPSLTDGVVYQDEWVHHLVTKFGGAGSGGVRFYAMDNEPDLWDAMHTDVHPVRPGYDDLLSTFVEYASAIRAVDPGAQVTGPVSWGWTGYYHSPRDRNNWAGRPDRRAHGDLPFIPWFLMRLREHEKRTGRRRLDVLDVHYYPQAAGVFGGRSDQATNARRLRSTRGLWDPTYRDESWIREPVMLLPRMQKWIGRCYPGTRLALTEWNWGADRTLNGAIAIAECLGIFGREGLYLANYWTSPKVKSPGYYAFRIYRNADGRGTGFGDRSLRATSSAPDAVSCFAATDSQTGEVTAMLINKQASVGAQVALRVRRSQPVRRARLWRYGAGSVSAIVPLPDATADGGTLTLAAPPYSVTLVRFQ